VTYPPFSLPGYINILEPSSESHFKSLLPIMQLPIFVPAILALFPVLPIAAPVPTAEANSAIVLLARDIVTLAARSASPDDYGLGGFGDKKKRFVNDDVSFSESPFLCS
jgi:hypothetical protein